MTDYPADIAEKARGALTGRRLAFDNETGYHALVAAIAQALMEERERAAEIALAVWRENNEHAAAGFGSQPVGSTAWQIAAAIRTGGE